MTVCDYTDTPFARLPRLHHKDALVGPSSAGLARRNLVGMMGVMMGCGGTPAPSTHPYIETDGVASYMDLGFVPTVNCSFELCAKMSDFETSSTQRYIQSAGNTRANRFGIVYHSSYGELRATPPVTVILKNDSNIFEKHVYKYSTGKLTFDSTDYDIEFDSSSWQMRLGAFWQGHFSKTKFYYAKYWESGVLIRDLVPYSGPRGIGLLDSVNDVLYTNANTSGTLIYGEE